MLWRMPRIITMSINSEPLDFLRGVVTLASSMSDVSCWLGHGPIYVNALCEVPDPAIY